ncbi:MAG: hypothetical protein LBP67_07835 [Bacteroidales bacterium]|jgi:hypothetical protein|nr:hypothetical protein [Bacteroidales bacterium]
MKKNLKNKYLGILFLLAMVLFVSCATLPKATVEMSILLEKQITALESNHIMIVNKYFEDKKQYAEEIIEKEWYPAFLDEFFKNEVVKEVWEEAVESNDAETRMEALKEIIQVIHEKRTEIMDSMIQPLEKTRIECISAIQSEYEKAKQMNRTITENISSVNEAQEMRNNLLPTEVKNVENIMFQYMEKADTILDKVQTTIEVHNESKNKINEIFKND